MSKILLILISSKPSVVCNKSNPIGRSKKLLLINGSKSKDNLIPAVIRLPTLSKYLI